jgi:hypothetical protein
VEHFEEIPVLVVVCLRGLRPVWPPVAVTSDYRSIDPSVQNLLLAARAAGLGAALITLPLWTTWLGRALGLPWRVTPCAVVPLGWPMGRYGSTTRRPVGEVVHLDHYGHQPFKVTRPWRGTVWCHPAGRGRPLGAESSADGGREARGLGLPLLTRTLWRRWHTLCRIRGVVRMESRRLPARLAVQVANRADLAIVHGQVRGLVIPQ